MRTKLSLTRADATAIAAAAQAYAPIRPAERVLGRITRAISRHPERRLSEALPVYAVPDQEVCGVDMSPRSAHAVAV